MAELPTLEAVRDEFLRRAKENAAALATLREALSSRPASPDELAEAERIAHNLAGAGGLLGFAQISADASALEEVLMDGEAAPVIQSAIAKVLKRIFELLGGESTR